MKHIRFPALLLALLLMMTGCGTQEETPTETQAPNSESVTEIALVPEEMFSDRDSNPTYSAETAVSLALNEIASHNTVMEGVSTESGILRITKAGTYLLSGQWQGSVIVEVAKTEKVQLVLDGASITSPDSAAILVLSADKLFLTLADGSENMLSSGESFVPYGEENVDAAVYSKEDLTINGSGKLHVTSPVGHGIVSKDDLKITGGNIKISAAAHACKGNDSVRLRTATLDLTAGKDGIHAENTEDATLGYVYAESGVCTMQTKGDGISASASLIITGGTWSLNAGGGAENGTAQGNEGFFPWGGSVKNEDTTTVSTKGLKSGGAMQISGGTFTIDSADDALHADTTVLISGGNLTCASGDDGIHAEGTLDIRSGVLTISESYEGLEGTSILISGGEIDLFASDDGFNATGSTTAAGSNWWENRQPTGNPMRVSANGTDAAVSLLGGMGGRPGGDMGGRPDGDMGGGGPMPGGGMGSTDAAISISDGWIRVHADGDGLDSNGTITVSGGKVYVFGPTSSGNGALDYQTSASITGGTVLAVGSSGMASNFSSATQGSFMVNTGTKQAGCTITLKNDKGTVLFTCKSDKSFSNLVLSTPDLTSGQTYTLDIDGTETKISMTSLITGSGGGMGGMGGGMPGGRW